MIYSFTGEDEDGEGEAVAKVEVKYEDGEVEELRAVKAEGIVKSGMVGMPEGNVEGVVKVEMAVEDGA